MAGGDYALIKSVEGFEDFAPFGRKQIADLGVSAGDVVFAITEGGETSFVIGTAWQGLEAGARVFFVYNNPDDVLRAHVRRSREVIDEPRIEKVNLTTGPMAITGSTRMQATSIELLAMLTVLEMALRELLAADGAARAGRRAGRRRARGDAARRSTRVHAELSAERLRGAARAPGRDRRADLPEPARGRRTSPSALGVDVLTDTTERSPTFCTPSFRKWDDDGGRRVVGVPVHGRGDHRRGVAAPAAAASPRRSSGREDELRALLDEEAAERQGAMLREIGRRELLRFRIGLDGLAHRPVRAGRRRHGRGRGARPAAPRRAGRRVRPACSRGAGGRRGDGVIAVGRRAAFSTRRRVAAARERDGRRASP